MKYSQKRQTKHAKVWEELKNKLNRRSSFDLSTSIKYEIYRVLENPLAEQLEGSVKLRVQHRQ